MEPPNNESAAISSLVPLLDENWNERKHLSETEFELRTEIQSLLQQGDSPDQLEEARGRERTCRASLSRNNDEYDSLINKWAAEAFKGNNILPS